MKGNKTDRKDAKWICDLYMRHGETFYFHLLTSENPGIRKILFQTHLYDYR